MRGGRFTIGVLGGGVAGLAAIGHLVRCLKEDARAGGAMPHILLFQKPRRIDETALCPEQRRRLECLHAHDLDPTRMTGPGVVYDPLTPSLFTFNGDNTMRGFDFTEGRRDSRDFFDWMQSRRDLLTDLYPDFDPHQNLQRHSHHDFDDLEHTSPRGAYGIYLHEKFQAVCRLARDRLGVTVSIRYQEIAGFAKARGGGFSLRPVTGAACRVDALICATGNLHPTLSAALSNKSRAGGGRVFPLYPMEAYTARLRPETTLAIVGAGPSGIELALHASLDWGVEHVTLVNRMPHARLPAITPTRPYTLQYFTAENFVRHPTAAHAVQLLKQEIAACYAACGRDAPAWDDLIRIENYPAFLERYIRDTDPEQGGDPNHPLALLAKPLVHAIYGSVPASVPPPDRDEVLTVLNALKHLLRAQSRPNADMLVEGIRQGRLSLKAGTYSVEDGDGVLRAADGAMIRADMVVLATGFGSQPLPLYDDALRAGLIRPDPAQEAGLARDRASGRLLARDGQMRPLYAIQGSSLSSIDKSARVAVQDLVARHLTPALPSAIGLAVSAR